MARGRALQHHQVHTPASVTDARALPLAQRQSSGRTPVASGNPKLTQNNTCIRRVYELAVAQCHLDGTSRSGIIKMMSVPFPEKLLVHSPLSTVQRSEGLLLWLSAYSHLPVSFNSVQTRL